MRKILLILFACYTALLLCSCNTDKNVFYRYEYNGYLDTVGYIVVEYNTGDYNSEEVKTILQDVEKVLFSVEEDFSISQTPYMVEKGIEKSTLMLINERSGTGVYTTVSDDFLNLLNQSIDIAKRTNGLFDPSIGALTKLWNISSRAEYCMDSLVSTEYLCKIPSNDEINEALALVNYELIEVKDNSVYLPVKNMALDFGAVGKGYACDKIAEYLNSYQFSYAIINMGGNVKFMGEALQEADPVKLYINDPFKIGNIGYYYPNKNTGGVTSGIYERYINYQGTKYHHLLNPHTGYPSDNEVVSVTIMGENSSISDALSTAVFMLGVEDGLKLIEEMVGYEAVIITNNQEVYVSCNLEFISEKENLKIIESR
ncbi:MAG: FAD:protein FMN transferase [Bacilli bacterium]|nr:FAD:protein FMN transferase [Bacilli bacterium]